MWQKDERRFSSTRGRSAQQSRHTPTPKQKRNLSQVHIFIETIRIVHHFINQNTPDVFIFVRVQTRENRPVSAQKVLVVSFLTQAGPDVGLVRGLTVVGPGTLILNPLEPNNAIVRACLRKKTYQQTQTVTRRCNRTWILPKRGSQSRCHRAPVGPHPPHCTAQTTSGTQSRHCPWTSNRQLDLRLKSQQNRDSGVSGQRRA